MHFHKIGRNWIQSKRTGDRIIGQEAQDEKEPSSPIKETGPSQEHTLLSKQMAGPSDAHYLSGHDFDDSMLNHHSIELSLCLIKFEPLRRRLHPLFDHSSLHFRGRPPR